MNTGHHVVSTDVEGVRRRRVGTEGQNVHPIERWISLIGGGALTLYGLRRGSVRGMATALGGIPLLYRGITGYSHTYGALGLSTLPHTSSGIKVESSVTVNKSRSEIYQLWRNIENLPQFMEHIEEVRNLGEGRSHWKARVLKGPAIEWDAEIIKEKENEMIAWRSFPQADIFNEGSVRFREAPGGRGTEVSVTMVYMPPAGDIGSAMASLFNPAIAQQVKEDLRRLKHVMEAGEIPRTEGQPSGRMQPLH